MSGTATNQYLRQVLHHVEAPPPVNARFFYTSVIPIDDPLSALPPTASAATTAKLAPKPFSDYDNTALDKSWNDLRRKTLKFNEEHGEKDPAPPRASRPRTGSSLTRKERSSSIKKSGSLRVKSARPPTSGLSQHVESSRDDEDQGDGESMQDLEDIHPESAASLAFQGKATTGTPFIRAPSKKKVETLAQPDERPSRPKVKAHDTYLWDDPSHLAEHSPAPEARRPVLPSDSVAVGASRLHQVEMPKLQMTPIYWTPVNDTAQVVRGTWFYQDTMLPVETAVANMLEAGYVDLKVWTETWKDELSSAMEHGADGETKIVHMLWPEVKATKATEPGSRPSSQRGGLNRDESLLRAATTTFFDSDPETVDQQRDRVVEAACDMIDVSTGSDGIDNKASGESTYGRQGAVRTYVGCGVIYQNDSEARILKPALLPSAYYGRRPLANYISKGYKLGVPVVRGFDQQIWDKLHPSKSSPQKEQASRGVATSASGVSPKARQKDDPEISGSAKPEVTDLIFVIHGIGQKLSQRMESFNFTHAINAFRREVMVECGSQDVKTTFRENMGGIMVLPVNWRTSLTFEEGGYRPDDGKHHSRENDFTLDDITPDGLASVRSIISDVMLDVPYYMSDHQPKMIAAVIREANRVYTLWCKNNPGFAEHGRVHFIAHSLGSVIAVDILSKQPTSVPPLDLHVDETPPLPPSDSEDIDAEVESLKKTESGHLLFNTHNLFLAGSPTGFFLLLRKAQLRARAPDLSSSSSSRHRQPVVTLDNPAAVYGSPGDYGCIAVQNIYNLINGYDPVACTMNATVDARYAASLKKAFLPQNVPGYWFAPIGAGQPAAGGGGTGSSGWFGGGRPSLKTARSARELELQRHEDMAVARERMLALNDNGQIDYFLRYGGGMLEIQYLTMLGAHSSYWALKDFIRVIVMETGRRPGAEGVLGGMRAVRKKEKNGRK